MAVSRGLNKGRGLGALIPQKKQQTKAAEPEMVDITPKSEKADAAKAAAPADKKPAGKAAAKPAAQKEAVKSAAKAAQKKQAAKAAAKTPAKKAAAKPETKTVSKPAAKAAVKKTAAKPEEKPAAKKAASRPAAKTAAKTAAKAKEKASPVPVIAEEPREGLITVRLTKIVPSRKQPRKVFDEEAIGELAASIKEHGVITPLLVRKKGEYFELIAGERRWRAAKMAGLKEVPVLLKELSEQETMEIALIDNLQREDLNAIEEARAYQSLIDEYDLKQEEIARRVSKSRSAVTNALRLLKLDEGVQALLIDGKIQMGHARALLSLEDGELQRITAERIAETQISVRETEKLVKKLLNPGKPRVKAAVDPQIAAVYADLEEQLRKAVGTRVCIQPMRGKKGKVEIEYYSNEDLERIIDKLR